MKQTAIYAGIIIDTNNFVAKTGMRTFEAAAFLRRYGADVTRVRKAFRNDMETYKAQRGGSSPRRSIYGLLCDQRLPERRTGEPERGRRAGSERAAQYRRRKGIVCAHRIYNGKIFISARSIDEVNVQIIMERLGGGGHMNIAGAQLTGYRSGGRNGVKLKEVLTQMTKEGAI